MSYIVQERKNKIESILDHDEKMEDEFINGILSRLTSRYIYTNANNNNNEDLVYSNYINDETFLNLVKICYGTLLEHAITVNEGEKLPSHIMINPESNVENNSTIIKAESGKIYYDKNNKLVSLYSNYNLDNNDNKMRWDIPLKNFQALVIDSIILWIYKLNTQDFTDGSIQGGYTEWSKITGEIQVILVMTLPAEILSEILILSNNSITERKKEESIGGTRKRKRKTNTRKKTTKNSRNKRHKRK